MTGIPTSVAASTLRHRPSVNRKLRREDVDGGSDSCPVHVDSALTSYGRPSGDRLTMTDDPRHEVGNVLRRQRLARHVASPIGLAQVGSTGDHCGANRLITHERQECRVYDRAGPRPASTFRPVATPTCIGEDGRASFFLTGARDLGLRLIGRKREALHDIRPRPAREHAFDQRVDLRVREITAGARPVCRHRRARNPVADHLAEPLGRYQREVDGVVQRPRGAEATVGAVTTGAVLFIEDVERHDLRRYDFAIGPVRSSGQTVTTEETETDETDEGRRARANAKPGLHRSRPLRALMLLALSTPSALLAARFAPWRRAPPSAPRTRRRGPRRLASR